MSEIFVNPVQIHTLPKIEQLLEANLPELRNNILEFFKKEITQYSILGAPLELLVESEQESFEIRPAPMHSPEMKVTAESKKVELIENKLFFTTDKQIYLEDGDSIYFISSQLMIEKKKNNDMKVVYVYEHQLTEMEARNTANGESYVNEHNH